MSLANTWLTAEMQKGKTQQKAMNDMNKATGYKVNYVQILRWKNGDRNPRPEARKYMLNISLAYIFPHVSKADREKIVEALL